MVPDPTALRMIYETSSATYSYHSGRGRVIHFDRFTSSGKMFHSPGGTQTGQVVSGEDSQVQHHRSLENPIGVHTQLESSINLIDRSNIWMVHEFE